MEWLYRVLENDDEGDPIDFGVVRATNEDQAHASVAAHLTELEAAGWDGGTLQVRFYPVTGYDKHGVAESSVNYDDVALELPAPK